ncbi:MAG: Fic family protein [Nanoarchaeota archaeon]|nr:Fic family protein [Nanoarchaeota archaeon]
MHIEIQKRGKVNLYYLAHSFRDDGKVRKVRRYLGKNLSKQEVVARQKNAEIAIKEKLAAYKHIRDPLHTILSPEEQNLLAKLIGKKIPARHLTEADWHHFIELFTFNTNAIEGSTITLPEVKGMLETDRWPDRPRDEIAEAYGVAAAVTFIRTTREPPSPQLIKKLHRLVFKNSKPFAGKFRGKGVDVAVVDALGHILHRGAPQQQVPGLLRELIHWYTKNKNRYHPLVLAAVVHNQFENIHPFQDGNGRVGRLLLNVVLLRHNLPPLNIKVADRAAYYHALRAYEERGDIRPTIELFLKEYRRLQQELR